MNIEQAAEALVDLSRPATYNEGKLVSDLVLELAEHDADVGGLLVQLAVSKPLIVGEWLLHSLIAMNLRGKQIAAAFEYCQRNAAAFAVAVMMRDQAMLNYVNEKCPDRHAEHGALLENAPFMGAYKQLREADKEGRLKECVIEQITGALK